MIDYSEWPGALAGILLILAIFPWPYGYYVFLRLAITTIAIYCAVGLYHKSDKWWLFVGLALLFNPIAPIYSTRGVWFFLDLIAAGMFLTFSKERRPR